MLNRKTKVAKVALLCIHISLRANNAKLVAVENISEIFDECSVPHNSERIFLSPLDGRPQICYDRQIFVFRRALIRPFCRKTFSLQFLAQKNQRYTAKQRNNQNTYDISFEQNAFA